jgi:hypothetical protein
MQFFFINIPIEIKRWLVGCLKPKSVSSLTCLIMKFLGYWGPNHQTLEDTIQELEVSLQEEETFEENEKNCEEQCEDFSQRLKESVREDKKFCKELANQFQEVHILVDLCAQRREEHDLIIEQYVQCFEVSIEEELGKCYTLFSSPL